MKIRPLLFSAPIALALSACGGSVPTFDFMGSGQVVNAPAVDPGSVVVSADLPELTAQQTGLYNSAREANCRTVPGRQAAFDTAINELRQKAAQDGADHLRINGIGPLEERGNCSMQVFRMNGTGYAHLRDTTEAAAAAPSIEDSLTTRLEEIDTLLDRGLINRTEHEDLRQRILDQAY
ncbi:MAG: hypothetical protein KGY57_02825 [Gammaproteobacteria bacterium]|nr:hypothetical protein [Gammaproteobacteria bacterium]